MADSNDHDQSPWQARQRPRVNPLHAEDMARRIWAALLNQPWSVEQNDNAITIITPDSKVYRCTVEEVSPTIIGAPE